MLFGASARVAKRLVGSIDPAVLAGLIYLGAGAGLAVFRFARSLIGLCATVAPLHRADLSSEGVGV